MHRFVLSTRIRGSESIVNLLLLGLWTLDAFVVVETFVVTCSRSGAPIQLWVVPRIVVVKAPDSVSKDSDSGR